MHAEARSLVCRSCGGRIAFPSDKHRFLAEKGYENQAFFCDDCISARLDQIWETPGERRTAICSDCGRETRLHFVPCKELPVYCPECHKKHSSSV
ncbi:MAG TPA: zinc-ribbon domain containing protein [Candidatus Rifleibacterium sp.]|nr:zinc-ribbon domain containing protein [Candidatus Rifleibacterium sp.]HPT44849.1 zinc-ribbon domain containing protein [Candidatus Rifleibacterium sp.]